MTTRQLITLNYEIKTLSEIAKDYNDGNEDSERTVIIDGVKTVIVPRPPLPM